MKVRGPVWAGLVACGRAGNALGVGVFLSVGVAFLCVSALALWGFGALAFWGFGVLSLWALVLSLRIDSGHFREDGWEAAREVAWEEAD